MDYSKDIVSRLLDIYERRSGYAKDPKELKAIQFDVAKEYPAYMDRYDHEKYKDINFAIEKDIRAGVVLADKNQSGHYTLVSSIGYIFFSNFQFIFHFYFNFNTGFFKSLLIRSV